MIADLLIEYIYNSLIISYWATVVKIRYIKFISILFTRRNTQDANPSLSLINALPVSRKGRSAALPDEYKGPLSKYRYLGCHYINEMYTQCRQKNNNFMDRHVALFCIRRLAWCSSMVSCQKGPTHHAYARQIGPFWQDTLELWGNL